MGAPSSLNNATTATGSVAEISAPNRSAVANGRPRAQDPRKPTIAVESRKAGIANVKIGTMFRNKILESRLKEDSNRSVGRKMKKTTSVEISDSRKPKPSHSEKTSRTPIPNTTRRTV